MTHLTHQITELLRMLTVRLSHFSVRWTGAPIFPETLPPQTFRFLAQEIGLMEGLLRRVLTFAALNLLPALSAPSPRAVLSRARKTYSLPPEQSDKQTLRAPSFRLQDPILAPKRSRAAVPAPIAKSHVTAWARRHAEKSTQGLSRRFQALSLALDDQDRLAKRLALRLQRRQRLRLARLTLVLYTPFFETVDRALIARFVDIVPAPAPDTS